MQVNAISFTGYSSKYNKSGSKNSVGKRKNINKEDNNMSSVSNSSMRNATKAMVVGLLMLPAASNFMTSCDAEAEAFAYAESPCCHYPINDKDTVYITLPGKTDTITQIIHHTDTVKIKDDFKSPVIDSINAILDDIDIDHSGGYIPLRVSYIDEMDTKYKKYLFDGDASAPDHIVYRGKISPFDDYTGQFIIGTPLDESENYLVSLTNDGKLYFMKMIPKPGVVDPKGMDDFMVAPQSFILDRDNASKLIRKLGVSSTQSGREDLGTIEKGETPKTLKITNPYGTNWRYTNFDVESADAPRSKK